MPRGKKKIDQPNAEVVKAEPAVKGARKAYPSRDERVAMADKKIAQLTALNAERRALIAKTEAVVAQRKEALAKSEAALNAVEAKKQRILDNQNGMKVSRKARAEAKAEEKRKLDELLGAIRASGKSVDEVLATLQQN